MSKNVTENWIGKKKVFLKVIHLSLFVLLAFSTCFGQEVAHLTLAIKKY